MRTLKIRSVVLLCALSIAAPPPASALEKIIVGHAAVIDFLAMYVARDKGFFEKQGLDITLQPLPNSGSTPSALAANSVQIASLSPSQLILADAGGLDLQFVAGGSYLAPGYHLAGIATRPDLDIKNAKDLEGKSVAVPAINAFLHILLVNWTKDGGGAPDKVRFVEVPFPQMPDALRAHTVDAAAAVDPFLARMVNSGAGKLLSYYTDSLPEGTIPAGLAATADFAKHHADDIKKFRAAMNEGLAYYHEHPQDIDTILANHLQLPPEVLKNIPRPPLRVEITPKQVAFWIDIMRSQHLVSGPLDAAAMVFP